MKDFSSFMSLASFVVIIGFITYSGNEDESLSPMPMEESAISNLNEGPVFPAVSVQLPESISFAGESVPLHIPDVRERLDLELQVNTYYHSSMLVIMKRANRWLPQIEQILEEEGIPNDFKYLPLIESSLTNATSAASAVGFWQFLQGSGREWGLEITREVDERYDPLKSTMAASGYLKKAYDRFGSWTLAAASYNRGMNGLSRDQESQMEDSFYDLYLNDETSRYIFRILAFKEIFEHPGKYGFYIQPEHMYPKESLRYVSVSETIPDLVDFAKEQGINYKLLKRHNPWLRTGQLTVGRGKSYEIGIPVDIEVAGNF